VTTAPRFELRPRRSFVGSVAAFTARRLVRFSQWRARRDAERRARRPSDQQFRSFIQINHIDLR